LKPKTQESPFQNPWPLWAQLILVCWRFTWMIFCSWTPKFLNPWRILILKLFGAKISGIPFVHGSVRIHIPWHLTLHHRACLGEKVVAYSLGEIEVHEDATVAQESYLCTGTHNFDFSNLQLLTKKITIKKKAFLGVRSMILPGIVVGESSIVGAQAVVTKNVKPHSVVVGNPARLLKESGFQN
jgi:putative colanic acid biosynthesis acetyltransferase WcaF